MARKSMIERTEERLQKLHDDADRKRLKLAMSYISAARTVIDDDFYDGTIEEEMIEINTQLDAITAKLVTILNPKSPE